MDLVSGFHLTCMGEAQENVNFFTGGIGQRMAKRTALFDGANPVYHLYYADAAGVSRTFSYEHISWQGCKGPGQVKRMVYSAPSDSPVCWVERSERRSAEYGGDSSCRMGAYTTLHVYPVMGHAVNDEGSPQLERSHEGSLA